MVSASSRGHVRFTGASRRSERGFTLAEVLVTMAIVALIGVSIPAAMSIGVRSLGSNGAPGHLEAAHDFLAVQEQVSKDINRATCIRTPSQSIPTSTESASPCPSLPTCSAPAALCIAWPDALDSSTCHVASYTQATPTDSYRRVETVATTGATANAHRVTTVGGAVITAVKLLQVDTETPLSWTNVQVSLSVSRTATSGAIADSTTITLRPFSDDPALTLGPTC